MARYNFEAICPYCKKRTIHSIEETGDIFIDCAHCGRTYVVRVLIKPQVVRTYTLVEHELD